MRIIAKRTLMEMATAYGDCVEQVKAWYDAAHKSEWHSLADVRAIYPHADLVGDKTVFNIKDRVQHQRQSLPADRLHQLREGPHLHQASADPRRV